MRQIILTLITALALATTNLAKESDIYFGTSSFTIFQAISEGQFALDFESYTKRLAAGLSGQADINRDGKLTLQELRLFLELDAINGVLAKNKQTPKSFIDSDFLIYETNEKKETALSLGETTFVNISLDEYKSPVLQPLKYVVKDAQDLKSVFEKMNLNKKLSFVDLNNENATRENILKKLQEVVEKSKNQTIIVYLSGHSDSDMFVPFETDNRNLYLSGIPAQTFAAILKHAKSRVWIISDTCLLWDRTLKLSDNKNP